MPTPFCRQIVLFVLLAPIYGCQLSSAYNADGVQQFQQGQHRQAMDNFERAVTANPDDPDAYYNLAATLHDLGRRNRTDDLLQQAESLYHRCLDLSPDHVDCHRALAVLLVDTDRRDSAFTLLERWAARSPNLSAPRVELARLNEEYGEDAAARQYLTQAVNADPTDSRAWAALARQREYEGRVGQALTNYQHAFNLNRYQPGVRERIASLQQTVARNNSPRLGTTPPRLARGPSQWVPR